MPDATGRHLLIENLVGEEMPEQPAKSHPNLLLKFAKACVLDADAVEAAEEHGQILPGTRAIRARSCEMSTLRYMHEAWSAILGAHEGQLRTPAPTYIARLEK